MGAAALAAERDGGSDVELGGHDCSLWSGRVFPADSGNVACLRLQTGCGPTAAELQAHSTGVRCGCQVQAGAYGRPGSTSSNSSGVRVRPASRQALLSHWFGSIVNARSTEPLVATRRPS